jgi:hypothetical protein
MSYVLVEDTPGVGSIGYDDDLKAVVVTWLKNDNDVFRPRLEAELALVEQRLLSTVIVDTSNVKGALSEANQTWLSDDFFPRLSKTSLRVLVSVVPHSAIATLTNQRSFRAAQVPFDILSVPTVDEAYAVAARVAKGQSPSG